MAIETPPSSPHRVALVTGGSRGLGRALCAALVRDGWHVVADGRDADRLEDASARMGGPGTVTVVAGDVADASHRRELVAAIEAAGGLDVVVNNASLLGPSPLPRLADHALDTLAAVYAVNTFAPLALVQDLLPHLLRGGGRIVNISSDAAVEAYEGWGGYGSSKAALDHITAVLAVEHPQLSVYAFDPGDMRTDMQQAAFPGEDISDRPTPDSVVPALMTLLTGELPSGRYRAADLLGEAPA
jgi:NAD(P)-dependent dehydrogenase (short-subunit alcohol dehydrogenase family)